MENNMDATVQKIFESNKLFHQKRAADSVEEKYQILLKLQALHIKFKKLRGEPLKAIEKVWGLQAQD